MKEHGLFLQVIETLDMKWIGSIGFMVLKNRYHFSVPTPDAGLPLIDLRHCILMFQLLAILITIATVVLLAELFLFKIAALAERFYALCCAKVAWRNQNMTPA